MTLQFRYLLLRYYIYTIEQNFSIMLKEILNRESIKTEKYFIS